VLGSLDRRINKPPKVFPFSRLLFPAQKKRAGAAVHSPQGERIKQQQQKELQEGKINKKQKKGKNVITTVEK
jgi:hypothetical protein